MGDLWELWFTGWIFPSKSLLRLAYSCVGRGNFVCVLQRVPGFAVKHNPISIFSLHREQGHFPFKLVTVAVVVAVLSRRSLW